MNGNFETAKNRRPQNVLVDRLPPYSEEAERGVLGCLLLSPADAQNGLGACAIKFKGKGRVFYDERHETIYTVLTEMYDANEGIDLITLYTRLKKRGVAEAVGGDAYLDELVGAVPSVAMLGYYLEILLEKYRLRRLQAICAKALGDVYDWQGAVPELLTRVEQDISKLTEDETEASEEHIRDVMVRVVGDVGQRYEQYKRGSMQLRGLPTGKAGNYLDKMLGGIRETYYMLLAGRPGSGKTSLAMNLVEFLAADHEWKEKTGRQIEVAQPPDENGKVEIKLVDEEVVRKGIPIYVFSMEMDPDCLVERLWFGRAGVDSARFAQGFATKEDWDKLTKASAELARSNIYIDGKPCQSIGQIAAKARRVARQLGIKLFVLDYVQLVEADGGNGDRQRELTQISKKIMALKKQLRIPWLVLAQMNRNIETAERERKPVLSDLKDCGALEQDCDLAMFTYKTPRRDLEAAKEGQMSDQQILDAIIAKKKLPDGKPLPWSMWPYRVDIVVPKYRFGPTGEAHMVFCKNLCKFEDWHLYKVAHGMEERNAGEGKDMGATTV